jgi:hypothetical protein
LLFQTKNTTIQPSWPEWLATFSTFWPDLKHAGFAQLVDSDRLDIVITRLEKYAWHNNTLQVSTG